jgi:hypothetical protein
MVCNFVFAQENYPVPPHSANQLFYIQHSNNHNTYVYDVKMDGKNLDKNKPIVEYRIVYTEGGVKKPLSNIQRKMAYGMEGQFVDNNHYEMNLAATKQLKFHLVLNKKGQALVYVNIHQKKINLKRMFLKIKEGSKSLSPNFESILFEGIDSTTGKPIVETLKMD